MKEPSPILMNEVLLDDLLYLSEHSFCCAYNVSYEEYYNAVNQIKFWAKMYKKHYGEELRNCSLGESTTATPSAVKVTENA